MDIPLILSEPDLEIAVIGPRPARDRPVMEVLRFLAINAMVIAGLSISGLGEEAVGRVQDVGVATQALSEGVALTAPKVTVGRWLELETSPFIEVGRRSDGSIDKFATLAAWHGAGITEEAAVDILQRLAPLAPAIIAVDDPAFERLLHEEATEAAQGLAKDYPHAHARLANAHVEGSPPNAKDAIAINKWHTAHHMWGRSSGHEYSGASDVDNAAMKSAKAMLATTTGEVGLRALRVPVTSMTSSWDLMMLSEHLHGANRDLQNVTGWPQGVLGLGGRVEFNPGYATGAEGATVNSWQGRLQMTAPRSAISHEWMHALDFVLSHYALSSPTSHTLSSQDGPLRVHASNSIARDWSNARKSMADAAPVWQSARRAKFLSPYWQSNAEEVAYAVQARVAQKASTLRLPAPVEQYNEAYPHAYPSPAETAAHIPILDDLFAKLAPLGLSATPLAKQWETPLVQPPTLKEALALVRAFKDQTAVAISEQDGPQIAGRVEKRRAAISTARSGVSITSTGIRRP